MRVYRGVAGAEEQAVILQQQNHPDLFKSKTSEEAKDFSNRKKNFDFSIYFTIADIQVLP